MPSLNSLGLLGESQPVGLSPSRLTAPRRTQAGVTVLPLLERVTLVATAVGDTTWESKVITDQSFENLGPLIQDMVLHGETSQLSGDFEWRVALQRRFIDAAWTPAMDSVTTSDLVLSAQSQDGYTPGGPFSDRVRLGVRIRLLLQWHATTGGAVGDKAEISLAAALRWWS